MCNEAKIGRSIIVRRRRGICLATDDKSFDVLILGAGESAEKALEAVNEKGQKALLINMDPTQLITLICQKNKSHRESEASNDSYQLILDKQTISTATMESTTFVLQARPLEEINQESSVAEEFTDLDESHSTDSSMDDATHTEFISEMELEDKRDYNTLNAKDYSVPFTGLNENSNSDEMYYETSFNDVEEEEELFGSKPFSSFSFGIDPSIEEPLPEQMLSEEKEESPTTSTQNTEVEDMEELEANIIASKQQFKYSNSDPFDVSIVNSEKQPDSDSEQHSNNLQDSSSDSEENNFAKNDIIIGSTLLGQRNLLWDNTPLRKKRSLSEGTLLGNQIFSKQLQEQEARFKELEEEANKTEEQQSHSHQKMNNLMKEFGIPNTDPAMDHESSTEELEVVERDSYRKHITRMKKEESPTSHLPDHLKNLIKVDLPSHKTNPYLNNVSAKQTADIYSMESIGSRRRSRAQKKSRLFANLQLAKPEPTNLKPETTTPPIPEKEQTMESESPNSLSTQSSDQLKRDDIEFEDIYGGYSSLEDFLTPQGNRKRQEMDQVEKRKIALRGLHNLINNLG